MANVGVIYSTNTGRIRWIHLPDNPGDETKGVNLLPGEAITVLPQADVNTLQASVNAITKLIPANDRYVFVPVGPTALAFTVAEAHIMDPLIDTIPQGKMALASPDAGPGWTYTQLGGLVPPTAVAPAIK